MRIAIIGAGISGMIANGAFSKDLSNEIAVFDSRERGGGIFSKHSAVMRLRNDKILDYIDCKLEKINVYKAICHEGKLYDSPNILLNNLYSLKAYEYLGERSIGELGKVERFLIKSINTPFHYEREKVIGIRNKTLIFSGGKDYHYDICISTIPMPVLLKILGIKSKGEFNYIPIHILKAKLTVKSDIHQTIYYTSKDPYVPYRITIEGDRLIAESIEETGHELDECLLSFGINHTYLCDFKRYKQEIGKMKPIDDDYRRGIMMDISNEHSIYSFGRFATWKPLRVDQTIDDIEKIKMFVRITKKMYYDDK